MTHTRKIIAWTIGTPVVLTVYGALLFFAGIGGVIGGLELVRIYFIQV